MDKKLGKVKHEWEKAFVDNRLWPWKLKTYRELYGLWRIYFSFEYDAKVVISLIMTIFDVLNPIVQTCKSSVDESIVESSDFIEENNNIFSVKASIEKFLCALVGQLYFFKRLFVIPTTCVWPLV